ncbi:TPA: hypothetical protein QB352_000797 [Pasteurella multocida]|nr:hypothetical protein [Pasteurella multocida]
MVNKKTLIIFPLLTQCIFSSFLPFFDAFNADGLKDVFLLATVPAFLFSLVCVYHQYHKRNLTQIAFFSGVISFLYTLVILTFYVVNGPLQETIPLWEQSLAVLSYAMMFAFPSMTYALLVLRLFLNKAPPELSKKA